MFRVAAEAGGKRMFEYMRNPFTWRTLLLAATLLLLAACATGPERDPDADDPDADAPAADEPDTVEPTDDGPIDADGSIRHTVDNEAVALLWEQAEEARANDEPRSAISALERALRVAPEDPVLWSRLAELQLEQGEHGVAENFAARSNSLAEEHRLLRYRNWLIIGAAREYRGDEEGAREARAEADRLRQGS